MNIADRIQLLQEDIQKIALENHRKPETICLLAVSKGHGPLAIQEAHASGIQNFAENYWQEAQTKMASLKDLPLTWHFIGPIQSNKASVIAPEFAWVHTVDREKIALLLSKARPCHLPALQICVQVNLDEEANKSGVLPDELLPLLEKIKPMPNLTLRGLMAIPEPQSEKKLQYLSFMRLNQLLHTMNQALGLSMDTLSMGMSNDWAEAIKAGASILRIGRAIFGERDMIS